MEGTIKSYKEDKRYGFILEDNKIEGENEIFFHFSGISQEGFKPTKGERVTYDIVDSGKLIKGKPVMSTTNIKPIEMYFS